MREYRGKSVLSTEELNNKEIPHENGWVYGWYVDGWIVGNYAESEDEWIAFEWWSQVIPETIGQFTGLHDKNGVEIYEGDVVDNGVTVIYVDGHKQRFDDVGVVRWDTKNGCLVINNKESTKRLTHNTVKQYGVEVIGTIHDKAGDE